MNSSNYVEVTSASLDLQFNTYIYIYLYIFIFIYICIYIHYLYDIYIVYNSRNPGHGHSLIKHIGKFIKHEALSIHGLDSLKHDLAANFCLGNPRGPGESNKGRCYNMFYNVVYIYIYIYCCISSGKSWKKELIATSWAELGWIGWIRWPSFHLISFLHLRKADGIR